MQDELEADHPELVIDILIVNAEGYDSGVEDLAAVSDLPTTQDDASALVWDTWGAEYRDTWVLDADNVEVEIFNLTTYDLSDSTNYAALYDIFVEAAGG